MRKTKNLFFAVVTFAAIILFGCSKSGVLNNTSDNSPSGNTSATLPHQYGVIPMTPEMLLNIPVYSKNNFPDKLNLKALPVSITLSNPAVRDQGQIGSCTAFCGAEVDEILYYYKTGSWPGIVSPAFIYYCERVLINKQSIGTDAGAYMVNIPQALQKYGACLESSYSYPSSSTSIAYKTAPSSSALTEGLSYVIGQKSSSYAMVNAGDTAAVKNLLRNNVPVMMGFNVYDTRSYTIFEGLNTKSYTYNPLTKTGSLVSGAKLLGGHAVPIIGYDETKQAFLCQNSWGTLWGNKGFFYIPYSVFRSTKIVASGDVYYATLN